MDFARLYPLTKDCIGLKAGSLAASQSLGGRAELKTHLFSDVWSSHEEADLASRNHVGFLTYKGLLDDLAAKSSEKVAVPYRSAYDCPAFGFASTDQGIRLFMRYWDIAPSYPCGHDIDDILRLDLRIQERRDLPHGFGPCGPLRTIRIGVESDLAARLTDKFGDSDCLSSSGGGLNLRYFPLKSPSPVVILDDDTFVVVGFARTAHEAKSLSIPSPQLLTLRFCVGLERAEDALAAGSEFLDRRWFNVVQTPHFGFACETRVWASSNRAGSKRLLRKLGGSKGHCPDNPETRPVGSGLKGIWHGAEPTSSKVKHDSGSLGIIQRGLGYEKHPKSHSGRLRQSGATISE